MAKQATNAKQHESAKFGIWTIHPTLKNGELEVIGFVEGKPNKRKVRFIKTGFETEAHISSILVGSIKDNLVPSVCGVGYLGYCEEFDHHPMRKQIYGKWAAKIRNSVQFGYTLRPEQLCFADFMRDTLEIAVKEGR